MQELRSDSAEIQIIVRRQNYYYFLVTVKECIGTIINRTKLKSDSYKNIINFIKKKITIIVNIKTLTHQQMKMK